MHGTTPAVAERHLPNPQSGGAARANE
jgi:hypothetical protein